MACEGDGEAFAAFSRLIWSLLSNISDFFGSMVARGTSGLGSTILPGVLVGAAVVGVEALASSTSPSSTSIGTFGVPTPRELIKSIDADVIGCGLTYLARD